LKSCWEIACIAGHNVIRSGLQGALKDFVIVRVASDLKSFARNDEYGGFAQKTQRSGNLTGAAAKARPFQDFFILFEQWIRNEAAKKSGEYQVENYSRWPFRVQMS